MTMNLSSSLPEKKVKTRRTFDSYFIFITGVFFLTIAIFVGLRLYISVLDKKLSAFDGIFAEHAKQLRGERVDRVAHFDQRLTLAGKQLDVDGNDVDSQKLLNQLESLIISSVKLTKYEYNEAGKFVAMEGETDGFKSVAQQIISFKSETPFEKIKVESLNVIEGGRVEFTFQVGL